MAATVCSLDSEPVPRPVGLGEPSVHLCGRFALLGCWKDLWFGERVNSVHTESGLGIRGSARAGNRRFSPRPSSHARENSERRRRTGAWRPVCLELGPFLDLQVNSNMTAGKICMEIVHKRGLEQEGNWALFEVIGNRNIGTFCGATYCAGFPKQYLFSFHRYRPTFIHPSINLFIHPFIYSFIHPFIHSLIQSFICPFVPPSLPSFLSPFLPCLLSSVISSSSPFFSFIPLNPLSVEFPERAFQVREKVLPSFMSLARLGLGHDNFLIVKENYIAEQIAPYVSTRHQSPAAH